MEEANTRETLTSAGSTVLTEVRARVAVSLPNQLPVFARGDWATWTFTVVQVRGLTHGWKVFTAAVRHPFS